MCRLTISPLNFQDEAFHEEASKILNETCSKVSHDSNISVLSTVLGYVIEQSGAIEASRIMMIAPFINYSLRSSALAQNISLQDLWSKVILFLDGLFSAEELGRFNLDCSDLSELLESSFISLPELMYNEMGEFLSKLVIISDGVARNPSQTEKIVNDAMHLFQKSFSGLCKFTDLKQIKSVASPLLERAYSTEIKEAKEECNSMDFEIAKVVCETLSSMDVLANDVATELFPSLCKLMNSKNDSLRRESSELVSKVDVSALMARAKDAEEKLESNPELLSLKEQVKSETERANNAEKDVDELKQMNTQLMKEVEYLRAEKAKLEQQVAVLSEGSAYM